MPIKIVREVLPPTGHELAAVVLGNCGDIMALEAEPLSESEVTVNKEILPGPVTGGGAPAWGRGPTRTAWHIVRKLSKKMHEA